MMGSLRLALTRVAVADPGSVAPEHQLRRPA